MYQPYPASPFARFAKWTARAAGHPLAFFIAVLIILGWALTGPIFRFSDTWQLIINTATTIVTFLMVFLIQNTQNRDTTAGPAEARRADPGDPGGPQRARGPRGAHRARARAPARPRRPAARPSGHRDARHLGYLTRPSDPSIALAA